jgi:hypothetical protein
VFEQQQRIGKQVVNVRRIVPHANRPTRRGYVERQPLLDLAQQVERVAAFAVELVDKSDDRRVAQPADLEELEFWGWRWENWRAPPGVLVRAAGSFLTRRWRRQSRANPSLKPKFPC